MNHSAHLDTMLKRLLFYCRIQHVFSAFVSWFLPFCCVSGVAFLTIRFLRFQTDQIFLLIALFPLCAIIPALISLKRLKLTTSDLAAVLDRQSQAGGLLLGMYEHLELKEWVHQLDHQSLASFSARRERGQLWILIGLLFMTACFFVPIPDQIIKHSKRPLNVAPMTEELTAKVDELKETGVLSEEQAAEYEKLLNNLAQNKDAYDPGKVFETIDSVESSLQNLRESAAKQMLDTAGSIEEMNMAAEQLCASPDAAKDAKLREMAQKMAKQLENVPVPAISMSGGLSLPESLKSYLDTPPPMDQEKLKQLAEALKKSQEKLKDAMKKLAESKELSNARKDALNAFLKESQLSPATQGDQEQFTLTREQLEELLGGNCNGGNCNGNGNGENTNGNGSGLGVGGVSRGRGDAPMIYAPNDSVIAKLGNLQKLNSDSLDLKFGESMGVSFSAPNASPIADGAGGGLKGSPGQGGESRTHALSPRDRKVIQRYFSDPAK